MSDTEINRDVAGLPLVGQGVPRVEDDALLRGRGNFLDDLEVAGAVEVAFLRSPVARAGISSLDLSAARALPGVLAVLAWSDIVAEVEPLVLEAEMRTPEVVQREVKPVVRIQPLALLAPGEVSHVGQPIAVVVAESRYLAEDAVELIDVEYDVRPALVDPLDALASDAPRLVPEWEDNVALSVQGKVGDVDAALEAAHVVVESEYVSHRYVASPLETRGIVAVPDPTGETLTVYASTQTPHRLREVIASCLRVRPTVVRVIAPDVGGGFGQKGIQYVEDVIVPFLARRLLRPVRWTEDRVENLTSSAHAREQVHRIVLAADSEGKLLAVRDDVVINLGSANVTGLVVPYNTLSHLLGPYVLPNVDIRVRGVLTNTMFTTPYRGAGRPEAVFAMERAMDRLALELGIESIELRARNLVQPEQMPYETGLMYRDGTRHTYDSGNFPELLRRAVAHVDLPALRQRQREAVGTGHHVGLGVAMYVEGTGLGPFESGSVTVHPDGRVTVATGASSQGQAHRTVFAQITADALGVPMAAVDVVGGDSGAVPHGVGTLASRSMVTAGNAIHTASGLVRDRLLRLAADELEADPADLTVEEGRVRVVGAGDEGISIGELAARGAPAAQSGSSTGDGAVVREIAYFRPPTVTVASAAHAVVVDVDTVTGVVRIEKYVVVHDCGRVVNPVVADGQVTGGVMQGIGGALYEHMQYGEDGQPRTVTYMDYLVPTAAESPEFVLDHVETPSQLNDLGVKGLGEGGAIAPPAAVTNAVEDALRPYDVHIHRGPLSPSTVRALIRSSHAATAPPER